MVHRRGLCRQANRERGRQDQPRRQCVRRAKATGHFDSAELTLVRFFQRYQEELQAAIDEGAIAFKSVIACRTGLDIQPVSEDEVRNLEARRHEPEHAQETFRDFLLCHTMDIARERGLWIHIHAAVGTPDIADQGQSGHRLAACAHHPTTSSARPASARQSSTAYRLLDIQRTEQPVSPALGS